MHLLRTLWEGRHIAALNALRSADEHFWEHLMTPLYECLQLDILDQTKEQVKYEYFVNQMMCCLFRLTGYMYVLRCLELLLWNYTMFYCKL